MPQTKQSTKASKLVIEAEEIVTRVFQCNDTAERNRLLCKLLRMPCFELSGGRLVTFQSWLSEKIRYAFGKSWDLWTLEDAVEETLLKLCEMITSLDYRNFGVIAAGTVLEPGSALRMLCAAALQQAHAVSTAFNRKAALLKKYIEDIGDDRMLEVESADLAYGSTSHTEMPVNLSRIDGLLNDVKASVADKKALQMYVEGEPYKEIAAALGIRTNTARVRVCRLLNKLRAAC